MLRLTITYQSTRECAPRLTVILYTLRAPVPIVAYIQIIHILLYRSMHIAVTPTTLRCFDRAVELR